jgi:hypothetical protein
LSSEPHDFSERGGTSADQGGVPFSSEARADHNYLRLVPDERYQRRHFEGSWFQSVAWHLPDLRQKTEGWIMIPTELGEAQERIRELMDDVTSLGHQVKNNFIELENKFLKFERHVDAELLEMWNFIRGLEQQPGDVEIIRSEQGTIGDPLPNRGGPSSP